MHIANQEEFVEWVRENLPPDFGIVGASPDSINCAYRGNAVHGFFLLMIGARMLLSQAEESEELNFKEFLEPEQAQEMEETIDLIRDMFEAIRVELECAAVALVAYSGELAEAGLEGELTTH